ncbi:MAG: class Ib ribonucleoside-diphosphate reductase assembly flavoprotein NrdI [Limosilactobacillus sp.]|uniref:class Ib ribonucleoside-diphosphate reductase assembly flavoprotein NrdI n=1 Tax=Limosilactobacillus sp. TaxID=2773925 RepID=UPI002702A749|nr:class Ib ribonucleoside-diphosphate reductase assembly flavoprotein NrdI [Limosilactobacillus sp.]
MSHINILYISLEGNTRSFLQRLQSFAVQHKLINDSFPDLVLKEVGPQDLPAKETEPFFVFVPTYLTGGNGINTGYTEIMTNALGEYIDEGGNKDLVMGVVGSGNRNFNEQFCLTARKYAKVFDAPFLDCYEIRGTDVDIERIYDKLLTVWKEHMNK